MDLSKTRHENTSGQLLIATVNSNMDLAGFLLRPRIWLLRLSRPAVPHLGTARLNRQQIPQDPALGPQCPQCPLTSQFRRPPPPNNQDEALRKDLREW